MVGFERLTVVTVPCLFTNTRRNRVNAFLQKEFAVNCDMLYMKSSPLMKVPMRHCHALVRGSYFVWNPTETPCHCAVLTPTVSGTPNGFDFRLALRGHLLALTTRFPHGIFAL